MFPSAFADITTLQVLRKAAASATSRARGASSPPQLVQAQLHSNGADHFIHMQAMDLEVTWWTQGCWGPAPDYPQAVLSGLN